jgi:hypothetical protein
MEIGSSPLQVVGSRIFMLPVWAEGAYVSRGRVDESMANHFVLALETLSSLSTGTSLDRAIMRPVLRVDVGMGAAGLVSYLSQNVTQRG